MYLIVIAVLYELNENIEPRCEGKKREIDKWVVNDNTHAGGIFYLNL